MFDLVIVFCYWRVDAFQEHRLGCVERPVIKSFRALDECSIFLRNSFTLSDSDAYAFCKKQEVEK